MSKVAEESGSLVSKMRFASSMLLIDKPREVGEDVGLAGDSELPPELLPGTGNVTRTPSPLPVREGAV
jgi:hypothetical protein